MKIEIIKSKRKSMSVTVKPDGKVLVKAPKYVKKSEILEFLNKHNEWIEKRISEQSDRKKLTENEVFRLKNDAKLHIMERVEYFSKIMGVKPSSFKITSAKTRWGSLSYKDGLCFSYRVMLLENHLIDYVVVHELSHILEKNHSKNFYKVVKTYLPNYKELEREIKEISKTLPY